MTVDVASPADQVVKKNHDMGLLVSNIGHAMRSERWTDVILISKERLPLPVHRFVLSHSKHLQTLLSSLSCCQGRCGQQDTISILLPDISYSHLLQVVNFLYTGCLQCSQEDREQILVMTALSHFNHVLTELFRVLWSCWALVEISQLTLLWTRKKFIKMTTLQTFMMATIVRKDTKMSPHRVIVEVSPLLKQTLFKISKRTVMIVPRSEEQMN